MRVCSCSPQIKSCFDLTLWQPGIGLAELIPLLRVQPLQLTKGGAIVVIDCA
jgi:hypothetical protein